MAEKAVRIEHKTINGIELRRCSKCRKWLSLKLFSKNKCNWDGLQGWCKGCVKNSNFDNAEKISIRSKKWRVLNPEKVKRIQRNYYQTHKEEVYEQTKKRRLANPERARNYCKKFHIANPEKEKEYRLRWRKNNPDAYRCSYTAKNKNYRATLRGKLCDNIASNLYQTLKNGKNGISWVTILGYNFKQLKRHLEKTMPSGYCWDDYMSGMLHMDHKIPISVFNFEKVEDDDFKKCWALKNLQLLPAFDNLSKGNKLDKHFQPSLLL